MRAVLVVRHDAERVASYPPRAERGSVVRTQDKTATFHGGKPAATCLLLGHVVTARPTNIISEK
jgi:hypothetical protein